MKFVRYVLLLLVISVVVPSFADGINDISDTPPTGLERIRRTDANIVGHVVDAKTKEHIPFVTVGIKGTTIGIETDKTGHYMLKNLPVGNLTLIITYPGYKTITKEVITKKNVTLNLKFELEENIISLDGVVVSANRNETKRRLAPALVSVLGTQTFEVTNSPTLAEGLKFQPGLRVEDNCQNCGFSQVRINGLEGPYTQILLDSRAIFSSLTGVYGLEMIPANMIERVEVMRGGSSALFGSSAIAGTVNIITKEPRRNSGEVAHTITNVDGGSSFDNNTSLNLSLVTDDHKAGLLLFGKNRKRSGYDYDGDGFTEVPEILSQTLGLRSYLKTSDYSKITIEYHHLQEKRRGGDQLQLPPHMVELCEKIEHSIDGGGVTFDWFSKNSKHHFSIYSSGQNTDRDSYYSGYGKTDGLNLLTGGQYNYDFDHLLFMPSTITAGMEYSYEELKDKSYEYDHKIDQTTNMSSFFVQNEWKNEQWSFLVGARLDKHNLIDHVIVSPRANVRFNPTEDINIRLGYSEGFRAPQAFDEDLHIGNVSEQVNIVSLDPNLKEERSRSLSFSTDVYQRINSDWQVNYLVDLFYTQLDDVFHLVKRDDPSTPKIIENIRTNTDGAKVWGVNIEGNLAFRNLLKLQAGGTLQRSKFNKATSWNDDPALALRSMLRTPEYYGYFTATLNASKDLTFALNGKYTGHMIVSHASVDDVTIDCNVYTPSFFELGAKVSYDIFVTEGLKLQVNGGVNNLFSDYQKDFDKGADRDSGYIYGPNLPRTFFAGIKATF